MEGVRCSFPLIIKNLQNFLAVMIDGIRIGKNFKNLKIIFSLCQCFYCLPPSKAIDNYADFLV